MKHLQNRLLEEGLSKTSTDEILSYVKDLINEEFDKVEDSDMKSYIVKFVFDDSSVLDFDCIAKDEKGAVNTLINKHRIVKQPKFVIIDEIITIQDLDSDLDFIDDFVQSSITPSLFMFKNKMAELITIGNITISKGHLEDWKLLFKGDANEYEIHTKMEY